ncbi:phosphoribosylformylglycinamidine cyclo-ligase [Candidatus Mycalebacterium sp.]
MAKKKLTYSGSGVNTKEGDKFVSLIKPFVQATQGKNVPKSYGGFSGAYLLPDKKSYLVGATDGVGTKLKIAFAAGRVDTIGVDLVAMCVNDILTSRATPLFFLDYIATARLDAKKMAEIIKGVARGCTDAGCALLGGETAEMPGFYKKDEFDLAGFAVGIVDKNRYMERSNAVAGDEIIALPSSGIHSNGYSLVRKALLQRRKLSLKSKPRGLSRPLADELLEPTKIYARPLRAAFESFDIHCLSHITGGGLLGNIPRSLPEKCIAVLEKSSWEIPAIFELIRESANLSDDDMFGVFNCGIGMTLCVSPADSGALVKKLRQTGCEGAHVVGRVEKRTGKNKSAVVIT